jgi:hypothetical protein
MKRGQFIIIFLIFILILSGIFFNTHQKITTLGCGVSTPSGSGNSNSNSNCLFASLNLPSDNVLTFASSPEVLDIALSAAKIGINTQNMPLGFKIHVSAANPSFASREGGTPPAITPYNIANTQRDCKLYTFTDRVRFSGSYPTTIDHTETDPTTGGLKCYYIGISSYLIINPIQGFTDCPEINPNQLVEQCAQTIRCTYNFDKTYTYGYIVIGDRAGCNPYVQPIQIYESEQAIAQALIDAANVCNTIQVIEENKCGDGKAIQNEECDKNDFRDFGDGKRKCTLYNSEEYSSGDLICNSNCKIDTSGCVRKNVEIISVRLRLDHSDLLYDFNYLNYLDSRGVSSSDYSSTTIRISNTNYLTITPDAGFSPTQNKGLVCVAKLNGDVSTDKVSFLVEATNDAGAAITSTTISGSSGNIVKSAQGGNIVYIYKVQKGELPRGSKVKCRFYLNNNNEVKTGESEELVVAKYAIYVLNAYKNELVNDYLFKFFTQKHDSQKAQELMNHLSAIAPIPGERKLVVSDIASVSEFNKNLASSIKGIQINIPQTPLDSSNPNSIDQIARPITETTAKNYLINKIGIFQFDQSKDLIVSYSYETLLFGGGVAEFGIRWHVMVLPFRNQGLSNAPEITLIHEMGHAWENLCDEYQYTEGPTFFGLPWFLFSYGWAEMNLALMFSGGCPNPYPECCKHEWGVTGGCGTWTWCPGMPFDSNKQEMNTYSEHRTMARTDPRIKYFSLMGGSHNMYEDNLNNIPVIPPARSDKKDYCPFRANIFGGCKKT